MTREELRDYVDEQRTLGNIPYHVYSTLIDGIDTLEQENELDKVRAEIADYQKDAFYSNDVMMSKKMVLDIIDKHKADGSKKA